MEPFHQCLALGPIAIYLLILGMINLGRRPLVVSGTRDAAVLGLAVSGLLAIGPLALLFPEAIASRLGPHGVQWVWGVLLVACVLGLVLGPLALRPRLVIYNISADEVRLALADLVDRLDPAARWAGDSLAMPTLGVQLHIDNARSMRNVVLASSGPKQDHQGWTRLEASLTVALRRLDVPRNPRGVTLLSLGLLLVAALAWTIAANPQAIARDVLDLLKM